MFWKQLIISLLILAGSFASTYTTLTFAFTSSSTPAAIIKEAVTNVGIKSHEVVGFLPYWLLTKADKDYSPYLTTLTYFALTISPDGTIQKYTNPGEAEPGWYALQSGKADPFLADARRKNLKLSLTVFSGNKDAIGQLMEDPVPHAANLMAEVAPIMKQYHFTDLNVDIESVTAASESARQSFTSFIKEVKKQLQTEKLGTLTIDSSPTDMIKKRLIDLPAVQPYIDSLVLMTYDYHYQGSSVTGPVAPIGGAGISAEFDVETGVQKALTVFPKHKVLLGVPLYGYQWETIQESTRSATLPGSGLTVSHRRMEEFLASCATCSAKRDTEAQEPFVVYQDSDTGMYYQAFFPDLAAIQSRIALAKKYDVGGIALWAIGYEGTELLQPLSAYKKLLE